MKFLLTLLFLINLCLAIADDKWQKDSDCKTEECCARGPYITGSPRINVCVKELREGLSEDYLRKEVAKYRLHLCGNSKCHCEQGTSCNAVYTNYGIVTKCTKEVRTLPRNDTCLGDSDCPGKKCCVWDVTLKQKGNICVDKIQYHGACDNTKCSCEDDLDCLSFDEDTQVETKCEDPRYK